MVFHGIDAFGADIRPPRADEKPALRWLAYGSSITHSSRNGYPARAASLRRESRCAFQPVVPITAAIRREMY